MRAEPLTPPLTGQTIGRGTMEEQTGASMFEVNVCLVAQPRKDLGRKFRLVQFSDTILVTHMLCTLFYHISCDFQMPERTVTISALLKFAVFKFMRYRKRKFHVGIERGKFHTTPLHCRYAIVFPTLVSMKARPYCAHIVHSAFQNSCLLPEDCHTVGDAGQCHPQLAGEACADHEAGGAARLASQTMEPLRRNQSCTRGNPIRMIDTRSTRNITVPLDPRDSDQPMSTQTQSQNELPTSQYHRQQSANVP